ncbi:MAG: peptide chain release factor N(5)-glutamine methyltransferase, partial [Methanobacteriota archaeon]
YKSVSQEVWTIKKVLDWSVQYFHQKHIDSPRLTAEWILCHALDLTRVELYLQFDKILNQSELTAIRELIKRRIQHEPLQYILGRFEFMGLEIELNPNVLIPRPETEVLVETLLPLMKQWKHPTVLEIGTGSGCIPIALQHFAKKSFTYIGLEKSPGAIECALSNFKRYELASDLFKIHEHDFLTGLPEELQKLQFEVILSNPPYVTEEEWANAQPEVRDFEPKTALVPESEDPLIFYRKIAALKDNITNDGVIIVEMSYPLHQEIETIFTEHGYSVEVFKDYSQKERILIASK